ncbi:histidine kinase [Sulfitobacter sp. M57]|uniref:cache domain-containing protein n=1 Tax=unclassified Sulfitobacter TaxID=196795 RepID=UPI0023E182B8|nr:MULTISPECIES: cache domain-containing protein [unclassified Sulfitobacter]MDF3413547.1 histidine kinase [Sulfitobacter sp. KE5]MDF3421171.1 histidine kinase [Sulfitobacter sp. KE43]MDF3432094.1 histidine kinase [Sulfitobacter sp. KE42]MDF3457734.1 histidine kinase [Sulfitobacter sp. S74]MDF3461635.1 histidine kinase [Sulfitobacter sp. Ks18]
MRRFLRSFVLSYAQKLTLLAAIPLIVAVAAIAVIVAIQARALAEREIFTLEAQLIEAKKAELRNYVTQARNGFYFIYGNAAPDDDQAKRRVAQILSAMIYGDEGQFFVYDYDGNQLVSPRQTDRINQNWLGQTDSEGTEIVDALIRIARKGAGHHSYLWPKPSTGEEARMITYVTSFPSWQWAVGTGVFIDDVLASVASARADVEARVQRTFVYIGGITLAALFVVFATGMGVNLRERRLADAKLKKLTERVFDAQEEERGRVARELHDGISQILVGVRYALDSARRRLERGDTQAADPLAKGIDSLGEAIIEVRRISRDLRPGVLDDLGLGPAIKTLVEEFEARTGIKGRIETAVFRNRLDDEAKIALYRIAQEALTNVERHAGAQQIDVSLRGHRHGATLIIRDNGRGIAPNRSASSSGLGLRNMQERMEQVGGKLVVRNSKAGGTSIEATVPLSHMLPPQNPEQPKVAAE